MSPRDVAVDDPSLPWGWRWEQAAPPPVVSAPQWPQACDYVRRGDVRFIVDPLLHTDAERDAVAAIPPDVTVEQAASLCRRMSMRAVVLNADGLYARSIDGYGRVVVS